jgi:hypothetical protein
MTLPDHIIDRFGIPNEEWRTNKAQEWDLFVEAQVWGSIPRLSVAHPNHSNAASY